jgi:hypothetical protein
MRALFLFAVVLSVLRVAGDLTGSGLLSAGRLATSDPDTWLRLVIVKQLATGGGWYNHLIARIDPPLGMVSPWTRPVDLLLLLFSSPLAFLIGFDKALPYGALLYSQTLLLASAALMLQLCRAAQMPPLGMLIALLLFLQAPVVLDYFAPLNADHHALLIFLSLCALWQADRWTRGGAKKHLLLLGAILGLGVWVSIEFLLFSAAIGGWIFLPWLKRGIKALQVLSFVLALGAVMMVGWLLEQSPATRWVTHYDALAVPYMFLMLGTALASAGLVLAERYMHSIASRIGIAILLYGAAAVITILYYPLLLQGPLVQVSDFMKNHFLSKVMEMQPIYVASRAAFLCTFCLWFFCALCAAWRVRQATFDRLALLHFLLATLFFAEALFQRRAYYYALPSTILLLAEGLGFWLSVRAFPEFYKAVIAVVTGLVPVLAQITDNKFLTGRMVMPSVECHKEFFTHVLDRTLSPDKTDPGVWLVNPNIGSQLLYVSDASILASNYHRNARGYESYTRLISAETDIEALTLAQQHDIRLMAVCPDIAADNPFLSRALDPATRPAWLQLREDLAAKDKDLRIFEVIADIRKMPPSTP